MHSDHRPPAGTGAAAFDLVARAQAERSHLDAQDVLTAPSGLPETGIGEAEALALVGDLLAAGSAQLSHPGFFAHMDPPTPWMTWVTALWNAALNPNLLHDDTGASGRAIERSVVSWLAPQFGMRGGHLVPGSTVANLTALWAAREVAGVRRIVVSERAHVSVQKSADLLGLPVRFVPADAAHRLRSDATEDLSDAALVLTAGTTATGAIDPLDTGADAAWRHVDAAWAGPLQLTDTYAGRLEGIEAADSVAISAHKWLYQPKESALVLFSDPETAHAAMTYGGGYLARPNVGLLGSHGAAAVSLFTTLLAWGRRGLSKRIEHDMATANRLAACVHGHDDFELWGPNVSGVVAWKPNDVAADAVQRRMHGAFVSVTEIDGVRWLRSVAANPNADAELVFAAAVAALRGSSK